MDTQDRTRRLFGKLFLFITPVFVVLSALGVYLLTQEQQRRATEHLATSLGNSSARVGAAISRLEDRMPQPSELRDEIAEELLFTLMGDLSIRCAQLEIAGSDRVLMAPQNVGCRVQTVEATRTDPLPGDYYGPLTVGYTQAPIREAAIMQRWYALGIMVIAITLALLSGWFAFRVIVGRPLDRMVESLVDAKNDAEAANVSKSRFLANMSHEIRTPLNGMIGTAELLSDTELTSQQHRAVQTIRSSGQALLKIIQDVLDYSKIESHTLSLHEAQFSLHDLVYDVAEMMSPMVTEKGIDICVDYPAAKRRSFLGDEGRLRQVLVNLVGNAVKFTSAGNVTIKVSVSDTLGRSNVKIAVRDTGIGIRHEHLQSIFSPFTQADDSTTRKYGGTGLGLAITREMVGLMGGKLSATSEYGHGSTFEVHLPFAHGQNPAAPDQDLRALRMRTIEHPRQRVLAVGAKPASVDAIADNFTAIGWTLDASEAEHAIAAVEQALMSGHRYSGFLIDSSLPDHIRGMIAQALRAQPETAGAPIIAVIPVATKAPTSDNSGPIDAYVTKPLRADSLIRKFADRLEAEDGLPEIPVPTVEVEEKPEDFTNMLDGIPVLVVDDSSVNREVVSQQLLITGADVHSAENGEVAVAMYKELEPTVILMDISMPVLDGISATGKIRSWEKIQDLEPSTIIALSANVLDEQKKRCEMVGMNGFIPKPSSRDHILRMIRNTILEDDDYAQAIQPVSQPEPAPSAEPKPAPMPEAPVEVEMDLPEEVISTEILAELSSSLDPDRFKTIVDDLRREASTVVDQVMQSDDLPTLIPEIHKVAGSSGMIGCTEFSASLQSLEAALKQGNPVSETDLARMKQIWNATAEELDDIMEDA